ncbi:hypothetical protein HL653_16805 [Sphingomonas sp. AP4-R1]|uniref:hypothetical protein n=1 Tax=Sphingomonas sp. AP4-R1 TaxID=2735134 RepID=UPI001493A65D|nr:hypothetical protein [Sphingomonas sp. AP4-R1]QJU59201.1 hypothetical protein HL653_16805 [Sphingomonas sp. AP4-R1]
MVNAISPQRWEFRIMPERAIRRREIERLRRMAERYREMALGLRPDDATAARLEALEVERVAARIESELMEADSGVAPPRLRIPR